MGKKVKKDFFEVGKCYFIRCVTHYHVGQCSAVYDDCIVLVGASWIASTGRFHDSLKSGEFDEIEPFPEPVAVFRGAMVDATVWSHGLPTKQK